MCYGSLKRNRCLNVWFPVRARTWTQDKSDTQIQQEEIWLYGILILFFSSVFLVDSWLGPLVPLSLFSSLPSVFLASLLSFFSDFSDFFSSFLVDGVLIRKKNTKIQLWKFSLRGFSQFQKMWNFLLAGFVTWCSLLISYTPTRTRFLITFLLQFFFGGITFHLFFFFF